MKEQKKTMIRDTIQLKVDKSLSPLNLRIDIRKIEPVYVLIRR